MNNRLIENVDSLFGLFNLEVISLVGMSDSQRQSTIEAFYESKSIDQLEEVCQERLAIEYLKDVLEYQSISHILILKVKDLVMSHAFLSERTANDGRLFMEVNVLCSRKFTSTGKHMLLAAENLTLRRGITFTQLSSVFEAIGFYEKMGYKTVPINNVCGPPNSGDTAVLEVFKEASSIIGSYYTDDDDSELSDEDFEKNTSLILLKLRFTDRQVAFLINRFQINFDRWENVLKNIVNTSDYFDKDDLLLMSKCLINSSTVGIFNTGI